jgi:hypothetical protein
VRSILAYSRHAILKVSENQYGNGRFSWYSARTGNIKYQLKSHIISNKGLRTMLIQFRAKTTPLDKLNNVFDVYKNAKKSNLNIYITDSGMQGHPTEEAIFLISASLKNFSILPQLAYFYKKALGVDLAMEIFDSIQNRHPFSSHIFQKARNAIFNDVLEFKREAQFPPTIIRRPEKNLYYATTFNMAVTRFFVMAHKELIQRGHIVRNIIFQNMETCDRCSMRLIQNFHLYIKDFSLNFVFYFKKADGSKATLSSSAYAKSYSHARKHCFRKVLNVAQAIGSLSASMDIDGFLEGIDFESGFSDLSASKELWNNDISKNDDAMDMVYKSNYEKFYCMMESASAKLNTKESHQPDKQLMLKLCVLTDSFNYNFSSALDLCATSDFGDEFEFCYFKLLSGLIKLKKNKRFDLALLDFDAGLETLASTQECLKKTIELGFLKNAKNLVCVLDILQNHEKDQRTDKIRVIIQSEHEILDSLLEQFITASDFELNKDSNMLNIIFIITTLIENISKLNAIAEDYQATIKLYQNYEYILATMAERMRHDEFNRSYTISFSHALLHIKMAIASQKARQKLHEEAYNITKQLLMDCKTYDVTGDYRGYILNAHSIYCSLLGKDEESFSSLMEMTEIYLFYNEPYMIKMAMNGVASQLKQYNPDIYDYLTNLSIIDPSFTRHEEASFIVSSPVDIENSLQAGLDKYLSGKSVLKGFISQLNQDHNPARAAYRTYGLWRQIYTTTP